MVQFQLGDMIMGKHKFKLLVEGIKELRENYNNRANTSGADSMIFTSVVYTNIVNHLDELLEIAGD